MFAVMGITGQVGGAVARALLEQGRRVRGVVRDAAKAAEWKARGVEIAVAEYQDAGALTAAFRGAEGVFAMLPPNVAPSPDFREAKVVIEATKAALAEARTGKVVALSSIGSEQDHGLGLITSTHLMEEALAGMGMPVAFLRAGSFMENYGWDVQAARYTGEIESYYAPADRAFPMVSTEDVGRVGARVLMEEWTGVRRIEVAGPREYSPADAAEAFGKALGTQVLLKVLPRDAWEGALVAQGMPEGRTAARTEMVEGFNSGWIHFGVEGTESVRGTVELEAAIRAVLARG